MGVTIKAYSHEAVSLPANNANRVQLGPIIGVLAHAVVELDTHGWDKLPIDFDR